MHRVYARGSRLYPSCASTSIDICRISQTARSLRVAIVEDVVVVFLERLKKTAAKECVSIVSKCTIYRARYIYTAYGTSKFIETRSIKTLRGFA